MTWEEAWQAARDGADVVGRNADGEPAMVGRMEIRTGADCEELWWQALPLLVLVLY